MGKTRRSQPFVWGGLAVLLLLAALGLFLFLRIPSISQLIPPGSTRLIVNITSPANGDSLDPASMTTVLADALGARPVASLQLWVDGTLAESKQTAGADRQQVSTFWAWTPAAGEHVLVVSATDDQGRQGYSDPVIVFATDPAGGSSSSYLSLPGESLEAIAAKLGLSPAALAGANPDLDPASALPADSPVTVPIPGPSGPPSFPPGPVPPSGGSPAGSPPGKLNIWLSLRTGSGSIPPAPALSAAASACDVGLSITPSGAGADGLFIYRLDGASTSFQRIATIGPGAPGSPVLYTDAGVYGPLLYYAAAFNAAGESDGNMAGVTISAPECKPAVPPAYELTKLVITPSQPMDSMYCYFSLADGQWTRIPAGDGNFVYPLDGAFDFSPYAGLLPSADFIPQSQCWGWRAGSLVDLGPASGTPPGLDGSFLVSGADYGISGRLGGVDLLGPDIHIMDGFPGSGPIMAPFNLTRTTSLDTCISHFPGGASGFFGPLFCGPAVDNNNLILVWDWIPTCIFPVEGAKYKCSDYIKETAGFRIYASPDGKKPVLVATVHNRDQHVYIFDGGRFPPGTHFTVRAFLPPWESADSNPYVLADMAPGTYSITLRPTLLHTSEGFAVDEDCSVLDAPGLGTDAVWTDGTNVVVGQDYSYFGPSDCRNWTDHVFHGRVSFDMSSVPGAVSSATLTFTQGYSISDQYLYTIACLNQLGLVTAVSGDDPSAWDSYRTLSRTGVEGTVHTVNATDIVRAWQLGSPNLGFVLTPWIDATEGDTYTQQCWTTLSDFQLTVIYYKK